MRPADNTHRLFKKLRLKASAELDERVHGDILRALGKSEDQQSAVMQPNVWRIIMKSKLVRRLAVVCCLILVIVSVGAAVVELGVYDSVQSFLSALAGKSVGQLVELADPTSAVPTQMVEDLDQLETANGIELVSLHADDESALAVTGDVAIVGSQYYSGRKQGPLVITFVKRDDKWWVTDIDLETQATAKEEVERFYSYHPNAVEIQLK